MKAHFKRIDGPEDITCRMAMERGLWLTDDIAYKLRRRLIPHYSQAVTGK